MKFACWAYHKFRNMVSNAKKSLVKTINRTQEHGNVPHIPWIRFIISLGVFILFYYLGVPSDSVINGHIDSTIWIGYLSLVAAINIGLIATAEWFSNAIYNMILGVFIEALERKLISDEQMNKILSEPAFCEQSDGIKKTKYKVQHSQFASSIIMPSMLTLVTVMIIMPLPIWFGYRVEAGLIASTVVWILGSLFIVPVSIWLLSKISIAMVAYCYVRDIHEKAQCPYCCNTPNTNN
jgi:hypothetical protein